MKSNGLRSESFCRHVLVGGASGWVSSPHYVFTPTIVCYFDFRAVLATEGEWKLCRAQCDVRSEARGNYGSKRQMDCQLLTRKESPEKDRGMRPSVLARLPYKATLLAPWLCSDPRPLVTESVLRYPRRLRSQPEFSDTHPPLIANPICRLSSSNCKPTWPDTRSLLMQRSCCHCVWVTISCKAATAAPRLFRHHRSRRRSKVGAVPAPLPFWPNKTTPSCCSRAIPPWHTSRASPGVL